MKYDIAIKFKRQNWEEFSMLTKAVNIVIPRSIDGIASCEVSGQTVTEGTWAIHHDGIWGFVSEETFKNYYSSFKIYAN